jgi:cytochrome c oxidase subunit 4
MTDHDTHDEDHGGAHIVPLRLLAGVLVVLLVLTWVTVAATWFDMGNFNLWVAMAIAVVKASLVALYFMHLRWERPINAIFFIASILFVALFIGIALMDTQTYQDELIPGYAPAVEQ